MVKPYIGITGITTCKEAETVLRTFKQEGYSMETSHIPMLGYLVSWKSLYHQPTTRRYPPFVRVPRIIKRAAGKTFTMIHYNSKEQDLPAQIERIFQGLYEFNYCRAVQLNIEAPASKDIMTMKEKYPELQIVIQLSANMIQTLGIRGTARFSRIYNNAATYLLIDPSGGKGKELDLEQATALYKELKNYSTATIGFAGGFTPENLEEKLTRLIEKIETHDFSIDVESGVRNEKDKLDIEKVKKYIHQTKKIFQTHETT